MTTYYNFESYCYAISLISCAISLSCALAAYLESKYQVDVTEKTYSMPSLVRKIYVQELVSDLGTVVVERKKHLDSIAAFLKEIEEEEEKLLDEVDKVEDFTKEEFEEAWKH